MRLLTLYEAITKILTINNTATKQYFDDNYCKNVLLEIMVLHFICNTPFPPNGHCKPKYQLLVYSLRTTIRELWVVNHAGHTTSTKVITTHTRQR